MKFKKGKNNKITLSEKIADALTLKPRPDIEEDQVFGTKPQTVSRADFSSSDSGDETAISDFRKRNVHLLSEVSKKYDGLVITRKQLEKTTDDSTSDDDTEAEQNNIQNNKDAPSADSDDSEIIKKFKQITDIIHSRSSSESEFPNSIKKDTSKSRSNDNIQPHLEDDNDSDGESDDYSITQFKKQLENDDSSEAETEEDESADDENDGYDISQLEEPMKEDFEHVKKQNVSEEAKKGVCIRNQLLLWEGLLEMRIHLQRCLNTANQMPMPDVHNELKGNSEFMDECNATKANIATTLDKFLSLQSILLNKFPETNSLSSKQKQPDKESVKNNSDEEIPSDSENEEIPSDTEDEAEDIVKEDKPKKNEKAPVVSKKRKLDDYEKEISTSHKVFKPFTDTTIQKWNDKTRLATATNVKNTPTNTILQQISYILSDKEKLIRRTQLKRSEYDIVGHNKPEATDSIEQNGNSNLVINDRKDNDEYIPEIFDDSDFYHQLLRELIECKSADISDPVQLSRQWIALQQMRSKMKRKVDTKATKGRKIKYVVHNQLVNYMAPEKSTTWNEESTNELYSSLFGKMFEQNNVGVNDNLSNVFKLN
ncbi:hypothetical protein evm_003961 [Chilo suppressalis]|nr:hypothetical protein evm_003961 [Chilo suppressalis]